MTNIVVIGAGAVGLTTAINIQKVLPSAKVKVISDKFTKDTTSHGAGGLFRPNLEHIFGIDPEIITRWSIESFKYYSGLASSSDAHDTGAMVMSGYVFSNTELKNPLYKKLVYSFREMPSSEIKKLNVNYKYGYQVTSIVVDSSYFLPWLMKRFQENGGEIEARTVESLEEFIGECDLVVNCSGFGSRELIGDKTVYPVRGHLIKVKAPWIKQWVYTDDLAYFIPGVDRVSLGGLRQKNNFSTEVDPEETKGIWERCLKLWPSLEGAEVDYDWVALRPHREPIRVQKETMHTPKGSLKIVHNYGHGANGISLAWGSALDATALVMKSLAESKL